MVAMVTYFFSKNFVKKKNGLDLKIFHFSQKFWKKYVAMATMICVKHFMNIPEMLYTYYHGCYGNIFFPKFL
jgi:hypothetical protein